VNVYKTLLKDPRFVAGAGAAEMELASKLQSFADSTPGLVQYAIKKYGESFEVIPRILADNAGLKSIDIIASLYASHSKGNSLDGLNVEEGTVQNTTTLGVYDLLATKVSAIRLATTAAVTVLQVDQIIMSKPAGGPKPPKQGPMDADD
jgi:T-complex protein 1 subunit theta